MSDKPILAVVTPCYNEQEVIEPFYRELKRQLDTLGLDYEIICVDDGSRDDTLVILNRLAQQDKTLQIYSLSRNFGHQIALSAGLDATRAEAVIMMDSDLQHPPALIAKLVEQWKAGFEIVSAVRQTTESAGFFKTFTSKLFYRIINWMSEIEIPDGAADFCLLSENAYTCLRAMPERHRFLRGMVSWIGLKRAFVPYSAPPRFAGTSKYSIFKMISLATEAILSFSVVPLKMATRLGLLVAGAGFCYLAWILGRYILIGDLVSGWGSLICVVLILGGVQLSFIGLIGQYLARVFEEAKGRPLYLLKQKP